MNNIIEEDDGFYFWDSEDNYVGPFDDPRQAEIAYNASLKWLARDNNRVLRKLRNEE